MRAPISLLLIAAAAAAQEAPPAEPAPAEAAPAAEAPKPRRGKGDKLTDATGAMVLPNAAVTYRWVEESAGGQREEATGTLWTLGRCLRLRRTAGGKAQDVWMDLGAGAMQAEPKVENKKNTMSGEIARVLDLLADAASEGAPDRVAGAACLRAAATTVHKVGRLKGVEARRHICWAGPLPLSFTVAHTADAASTAEVDPPLPVMRWGLAQSVVQDQVREEWVKPPGQSESCVR